MINRLRRLPAPHRAAALLAAVFALTALPAQPLADRAAIQGSVTDGSGKPVVRASVAVTGTGLATTTDEKGDYHLASVPAGSHELLASSVGFGESRARVTVSAGRTIRQDFTLGGEIIQLGTVVVQGTRDGQARALTQQKNAINLMTVVSSDAVGRFPDAYVGDALRRLVGVVVEEDQGEATGVTIRGIEPDYNNITINGLEVAATGTPGSGTSNQASRPVSLDVFSVDLIESIEVAKATTPDMDGNGLGGAVNVKTKNAFTRGIREFTASGEYTYADLYEGREGYRATATYSDVFGAEKRFGALVSVTREERDRRVERVIPMQYNAAGVLQRARANGYNQTLERMSYLASFDYKLGANTRLSFKPSYSKYDDTSDYDRAQIHADQGRYQNEYVKDHRFKKLHTFDLSGETRFGSHQLRVGALYSYSDETKPENQKHVFRTANNAVRLTFDQSDPVKPYPVLTTFAGGVPATTAEKALFTLNEAKFRGNYQEDERRTVYADYTRDLVLRGLPVKLKTGAKFTTTEKFDNAWSYVFGAAGTVLNYNQFPDLPATRIQDNWRVFVLDKAHMLQLANGAQRDTYFRYRPQDSVSDCIVEDFSASEDLYAGYVSAALGFPRLRLEGGVRYERLRGRYTNYGYDEAAYNAIPATGAFIGYDVDPVAPFPNTLKVVPGRGDFADFLPSLHARYTPAPDWVIRSAVSTNVGRPRFTDVAGLASFRTVTADDGSSFRLTTGNPDLQASRSVNYDLTVSYFGFKPLGLLEFGGFHKQIKGRVYREVSLRPATAADVALYRTATNGLDEGDLIQVVSRGNADTSTISGFEFDWRMELAFLPGPLAGLGLGANYTYAKSEETIPFIQTLPRNHPSQPARAGQTVPYPRQPENSGNYYLSFHRWGLDARYSANYIGRNLRSWNDSNPLSDQFNRARWRYDVLVSYAFRKRWAITASVINLTDEPLITYTGLPHLVNNSEFQGRTMRVGLRYVFR